MRILLDESLPKRLKDELTGHDVSTVFERGWSGVSNGRLLALAANSFDVFVTADQNLQYQQNLAALPIAVVVLVARDSRLETLQVLVPELLQGLVDESAPSYSVDRSKPPSLQLRDVSFESAQSPTVLATESATRVGAAPFGPQSRFRQRFAPDFTTVWRDSWCFRVSAVTFPRRRVRARRARSARAASVCRAT